MKKISIIFILSAIWLTTSCLNENELQPESKFKADIIGYLESFKNSIDDEGALKIDELLGSIDFKKVTLYGPKGSEDLLVVEMNSIDGFLENEKLSAVFFLEQGTIVRASIIALSNDHQPDQLIPSFFNSVIPKNYSG